MNEEIQEVEKSLSDQEREWQEHLASIKKTYLKPDEDGLFSIKDIIKREWYSFKELCSNLYDFIKSKLRSLYGDCEDTFIEEDCNVCENVKRKSIEEDRA